MNNNEKETALIEKILKGKPKELFLTSDHVKKVIEYCNKNKNENQTEIDFEKSVYNTLGIIYPND